MDKVDHSLANIISLLYVYLAVANRICEQEGIHAEIHAEVPAGTW
jgi:hypothetical protein